MSTHCPDINRLRQFLAGELEPDESEPLASHFESCDTCARLAESIEINDPVAVALASAGRYLPDRERDETIVQMLLQQDTTSLRRATEETIGDGTPVSPPTDQELAFLSPPQDQTELGRLGNFRVLEVIGRGGMGLVFRAQDTALKREIALKVMKPSLHADHKQRERFLREAQAAASINHENVVPIHAIGEEAGVPFMVMPLLAGEPLSQRLTRDGAIPVAEACKLVCQAAKGLAAAHQNGLLHRDIKPENLWIDGDGNVRLLDFGLARVMDDADGLTVAGSVVGTPRYMSPEQADGQPLNPLSDLFSLGSVFYHMLAGRPPFNQPNLLAILKSIGNDAPQPVTSAAPETPAAVAAIVHRLLEKRPEDRFESATALARELEAVAAGLAAADNSGNASVAAETASKSGNRRGLVTMALGSLAALVLFGLMVLRINTNHGTLIVEIAEDSQIEIQTRLQEGSIDIVDNKNDRVWNVRIAGTDAASPTAGKLPSRQLPSGEYQVRLPQGLVISDSSGAHLQSESFELRRGDEVRLRVTLAAAEVQPSSLLPSESEPMAEQTGSAAVPDSITPVASDQTSSAQSLNVPTGINQTALQFNGIDNYVDITSDWTWEGQDFTFEAWLTVPKLADDAPQITLLSLEHGKTERTGLRLSRQLHRSLGSRVLNSSIYQSEFHPLIRDEIPTNQLTHLAVSWSNSSASFFVDGHKQPAGESRHIYILNKDGDLKHTYLAAFGGNKNSDNPQFFWRGLIHQARFTSGVLYDTDFTPEQEFTPQPETIALYKFDEGTGDVLHDSSGNARHGKIHGATWIEWDLQRPILVQPGQPLAPRAVVHRPTPIPGLQSWSIESPSIQDACVSSVAWHPSGEWFIALDSQGILRVWGADGQLSQVIHACQVTGGSPGNAAFFDNGNLLATLPYSGDGILRIWETSTWKCVREIKTPQSFSPTGIASSTAGRRLAVAGGRGVLLVDPLTQQMSEASLDGHCNAVAVSPDGKTLIVARESGNALLWIDAESLKTLHTVELSKETDQRSRYGTHLAFSPDGRWVACSTVDGVVQLFDAETTEQKGVFKPGVANCYTLEWFQDSRRFAVASGGVAMVSVWDITQPDAPLLKTGDGNVIALSISPDQSEIIYHSTNRELYSLNLASGLTRRAINQQGLVALSPPVALSQQGDRLADLHRGVLTVWDSETGQPLQRLGGVPDSTRLSWSPSGQQIVASNWNTAEGKPSLVQLDSGETIQPTNQPRMVWSTAWSPDGKWLAIGGKDQPIEIVTAQTGEVVRQFGDESKSAFSLVWSPDGESLAAWTMDRFVRVWNTATGTVKAEENQFADPPGMYFNYQLLDWYPDNRRLCLALFTNVTIWDIETGEQSPLEHFSSGGSLAGVSLAPDGSSLLVYDGGGRYFWRGATTDNRKSLGPLGSNPAWHPDSRRAIVNRTSGIFTASSFGYDTSTFEKLGTSLRHFPGGGWIVIGPEGHYRGGVLSAPGQPQGSGTTPEELAKIERHIVYTTLNEDGTRSLYTPAEFRATFNWQNDPNKATLLTVPSSPPTPP